MFADLLRSIFREISKINVKIDILQKDVSTIIESRNNNDDELNPYEDQLFSGFPVSNVEELETFLEVEENFNKFVSTYI